MKKTLIGAAAVVLGLAGALAFVSPASAIDDANVVKSECRTGWFVNPDEAPKNLPVQVADGFLLDGPKLFKRSVSPALVLEDVPTTMGFESKGTVNAEPLFKMETTAPYSTINRTADGTFWSSKIPAVEDGGQNKPLATLGEFVGITTTNGEYGEATKVTTFGVGYGNDEGNKTTVTSVTFGTKYELSCKGVRAAKPDFTEPSCKAAGDLQDLRGKVTGVVYEYLPVSGGKTKVIATAAEGYHLTNAGIKDGKVTWIFDSTAKLTGPENNCAVTPPTTPPGTKSPTPSQSTTAAPVPSDTESTESQNAGLPVTGPGGGTNVPLVGTLAGTALLALGAALFMWTKRRRDNDAVEFTA